MGYLSEMPTSPSKCVPAGGPPNDGWPSPQSPRAPTPGYRPPTPYHARAPASPPPQIGRYGLDVPRPRSPAAPRSHHSFHDDDDDDDSTTLAPSDSLSYVSARRRSFGLHPHDVPNVAQRGSLSSAGYYAGNVFTVASFPPNDRRSLSSCAATAHNVPVIPGVNVPLVPNPVQPGPLAAAYAGNCQRAYEPAPAWVITAPLAPNLQPVTPTIAGYAPAMTTAVQPLVQAMSPTSGYQVAAHQPGGHQIVPVAAAPQSGMAFLSPTQAGNPYRVRASSITHTGHGETTHVYTIEAKYRP